VSDHPAAWYPDPTGRYPYRWFDGRVWTNHVASPYGPGWDPFPGPGANAAYAVGEERTWAKVFRIATAISLALAVAGGVVLAVLAYWIATKGGWRWIHEQFTDGDPPRSFNVSLPLGITGILGAVWAYQATRAARSLGLPTAHTPGWAAAGHLVPVINLWFPYQVMRDLFPIGERPGRRLAVWWTLHIGAAVPAVVGAAAALAGAPVLAACGFGGAAAAGAASFGLQYGLVAQALAVHERLVGSLRS
jgi:hypothetical protein